MNSLSDTLFNEYCREQYAWRKSHHICTKCGCETAAKGRTMCITCLEKKHEYNKHYYKKLSTEQRYAAYIHNKRRRDLMVAFGVCIACEKRNAAPGHVYCNECLIKHRRESETERRKAGIYPHDSYSDMCIRCGKNPPFDGKKLCDKCYKSALQSITKAVEVSSKNRNKHIWQTLNGITFGKSKKGGRRNEIR